MSIELFIPADDHEVNSYGWPDEIVAKGSININLRFVRVLDLQPDREDRDAYYVDQFHERYTITRLPDGQLVGYIRED